MARRAPKPPDVDPIPAVVRDETITVPLGETAYWLLLADEEVELMARGICPADVSRRAWDSLDWKRRYERMSAREAVEPAPAVDAVG